jgi:hypothetical protein
LKWGYESLDRISSPMINSSSSNISLMKGFVVYMVYEFCSRLRMGSALGGALFLVGVRL